MTGRARPNTLWNRMRDRGGAKQAMQRTEAVEMRGRPQGTKQSHRDRLYAYRERVQRELEAVKAAKPRFWQRRRRREREARIRELQDIDRDLRARIHLFVGSDPFRRAFRGIMSTPQRTLIARQTQRTIARLDEQLRERFSAGGEANV